MNNSFSLIGSEIINGNNHLNTISNISPVQEEGQKIITKTYRIINTPTKERTLTNDNNNNNNSKIYSEKKSATKRGNSLDLSKVMYRDGYILNDALNSNPGFGLWSLKITTDNINNTKNNIFFNKKSSYNNKLNENNKIIFNKKSSSNNIINDNDNSYKLSSNRPNSHITNNIYTMKNSTNISSIKNSIMINDKSMNKSLNTINEISFADENKKKNKKFIEELKLKCKDLEEKYFNIMTNYEDKGEMCKNSLKIKREYEKILQDNAEDNRQLKEQFNKISIENSKLKKIYGNTKNEVDRLLNIIKTDKNKIIEIREEYEKRLINEENERARLNNILKIDLNEKEELQKCLYDVEDAYNPKKENNSNNNNNNNNNLIVIKDTSHKKDLEIKQLNDIILELELKISKLRKKIAKTNEENDKLRYILRFKEYKDEIERNKMETLNNLLEMNINNQKDKMKTITEQNMFINNWKKKVGFQRKTNNNRLTKSVNIKNIINTNINKE